MRGRNLARYQGLADTEDGGFWLNQLDRILGQPGCSRPDLRTGCGRKSGSETPADFGQAESLSKERLSRASVGSLPLPPVTMDLSTPLLLSPKEALCLGALPLVPQGHMGKTKRSNTVGIFMRCPIRSRDACQLSWPRSKGIKYVVVSVMAGHLNCPK